jgi:hypothetical protein
MFITILLLFFAFAFFPTAFRLGDGATYSESDSDDIDYLELFIIRS